MNIISYTDYANAVDVTETPVTFSGDDTEHVVSITPSSSAKMIKVIYNCSFRDDTYHLKPNGTN
jgi:hypothetical protein